VWSTDHGGGGGGGGGGVDQRWVTAVSPSSMTMPTASTWTEHYFTNYTGTGPLTPFSPPAHGTVPVAITRRAFRIHRMK